MLLISNLFFDCSTERAKTAPYFTQQLKSLPAWLFNSLFVQIIQYLIASFQLKVESINEICYEKFRAACLLHVELSVINLRIRRFHTKRSKFSPEPLG